MKLLALFAMLSLVVSCSCGTVPIHMAITKTMAPTPVVVVHQVPPGHVDLKEEITEESADRIVSYLNKNPGKVTIDIDSPGGQVGAGLMIIQAIQEHGAPVICKVDGKAASMAFVILESCTVREATDYSFFMGHSASVKFSAEGHGGEIGQAAANTAAAMTAISRGLAYHVCRHIPKLPLKGCVAAMSDSHELWFSADDLLELDGLDLIVP